MIHLTRLWVQGSGPDATASGDVCVDLDVRSQAQLAGRLHV